MACFHCAKPATIRSGACASRQALVSKLRLGKRSCASCVGITTRWHVLKAWTRISYFASPLLIWTRHLSLLLLWVCPHRRSSRWHIMHSYYISHTAYHVSHTLLLHTPQICTLALTLVGTVHTHTLLLLHTPQIYTLALTLVGTVTTYTAYSQDVSASYIVGEGMCGPAACCSLCHTLRSRLFLCHTLHSAFPPHSCTCRLHASSAPDGQERQPAIA